MNFLHLAICRRQQNKCDFLYAILAALAAGLNDNFPPLARPQPRDCPQRLITLAWNSPSLLVLLSPPVCEFALPEVNENNYGN